MTYLWWTSVSSSFIPWYDPPAKCNGDNTISLLCVISSKFCNSYLKPAPSLSCLQSHLDLGKLWMTGESNHKKVRKKKSLLFSKEAKPSVETLSCGPWELPAPASYSIPKAVQYGLFPFSTPQHHPGFFFSTSLLHYCDYIICFLQCLYWP